MWVAPVGRKFGRRQHGFILLHLPSWSAFQVMGLCIDAMQDNIEFFFGRKSVEDVDFSTLVLEWATLRWFHYAQTAPPQQAAEKQSPVLGELD